MNKRLTTGNFPFVGAFILMMNYKLKLLNFFLLSAILLTVQVSAQDEVKEAVKIRKINFGYSTNPTVKSKKDKENSNTAKETTAAKVSDNQNKSAAEKIKTDSENNFADKISENAAKESENIEAESVTEVEKEAPIENEKFETVAKKTLEIAKRASRASLPPTEMYKVGAGDVLFISLQNVPAQASKYYTVLDDGTIDYPLAGEMISVLDLTTDEIEEFLREKIKIYENPQISVKVREHASHQITVLGLVEKPGDKFLQREAIPLYVIRAEAIVRPNADRISIKRKDSTLEEFNLSESQTDEVLIYTGDIVEFIGAEKLSNNSNGFYYIGGEINQGGQMNFHQGITLTQAILAAGGLKNSETKKIVIRSKDEKGLLHTETYNLKDIKKGKTPDPLLKVGDTIEVEL